MLDGGRAGVADAAGIQFRMLNASKGPAVRGPRAQDDRKLYRQAMLAVLAEQANLTIVEAAVEDLLVDAGGRCTGAVTADGAELRAAPVVLTTGPFLRGLIHIGEDRLPAGRVGEPPAVGLAATLERAGFRLGRLKTGTPPRLDGRTIDYAGLQEQVGDDLPDRFSTLTPGITHPQVSCHTTPTSEALHTLSRANLHTAPPPSGH